MRASGADALIAESEESGMTRRFKAQIAGRSLRVSDMLNFIKTREKFKFFKTTTQEVGIC
jgi:hypothetical protein